MQCFNPQNSNHGIYYSKSFTESKFDAINIYIYIQWNQQLSKCVFSNVIECLKPNIRKEINCKRLSSTKRMTRVKTISIKICKRVYNRRLVLAVFASTKLTIFLVFHILLFLHSAKVAEISCKILETKKIFPIFRKMSKDI